MLKCLAQGAGYLAQEEVAQNVADSFGEPWVYYNDGGNLAISREVLAEFRALTPDVVWDRSARAWRFREVDDDPTNRGAV